jgi:hypothetical protein
LEIVESQLVLLSLLLPPPPLLLDCSSLLASA